MWMKNSTLRKIAVVVFSIFIVVSTKLTAQETLLLDEAINMALQNNYDIQLSKKNVAITEIENSIGNAGFLPQIAADGTYNSRIENTELSFADGTSINRDNATSNSLDLGVGLNWYIFDGTKMFIAKNKFEALEELAVYDLKATINNTTAEVINTFYQITAEQRTLDRYLEQEEYSEQRLKLSEVKVATGAASQLDVLQARVDLSADRSTIFNQEIKINMLKKHLNRLLGRKTSIDFLIIDSIPIGQKLDKENLEKNLEENPNLKAYKKDISIAVMEKKETFASRLPKIALNGRYSYNNSESEAGFISSNKTDGINYGATISIPIFNGFQLNRAEQINKIRIEQLQTNYEAEFSKIEEAFSIEFYAYEKYLQLLEMERSNVKTAKANLDFALKSYDLGSLSAIDLREIQLTTLAAEERLIAVQFTLKATETELLRLTNQLIQPK